MRLGLLPLGRPTFDVPYAEEMLAGMLAALDATPHELVGPRTLLFDAEGTEAAIADLQKAGVDHTLILQVTFTDASMTVAAANALPGPLSIWAVPEPRLGGRLRLNAFCGLNLASHALGLTGRAFGWLYAMPEEADVAGLLSGARMAEPVAGKAPPPDPAGAAAAAALAGRKIGRVGEHPVGFDTCRYDAGKLRALAGVEVDALELDTLFDHARAADASEAAALRTATARDLPDLDHVDQGELDRSLRLRLALDTLRSKGSYAAFAIRCWPETFTEYGGAVCGPVAQLGEARVPCACEADVYGALTQMLAQEVADAPPFLVDLVDMDVADNSGVVWHCGQAPLSMADPEVTPSATVHTNRKMPLLYEFPLKPGRVTLVRISQARGRESMVLAGAEMLKRPKAFTGTSGTLRFDRPAEAVLQDVIGAGLEHHMALVYGEHRPALRGAAEALGLPVLEI